MQPQEASQSRIMGILATRGVNRPASSQDPFPGRTGTFRDISRIGLAKGVYVCIFGPRDIDRRAKRVHGHFYTPGKGWTLRTVPLPQVIYNRVANRRVESLPRVQRLMRWLRDQGSTVFNPSFLDKWEVYACLQADPLVRANVPATVLYSRSDQVPQLLKEWGSVYCKPRRGSLGNGIAALKLLPNGQVRVHRNGVAVSTVKSYLPSLNATRRWAKQKLRPMQVCLQHGVSLASAHGRRFDIRALVQKDETGVWRFTGAAARLAAKGQLTTHVPRGGVRMSLTQALMAELNDKEQVKQVEQRLAGLSEAAAACLERGLGDEYGEFSLDVGMDHDGQLWIFEMNAKPFRFDEAMIRKKAYRRLVGFAKHLVEQENQA